MLQTRKWGGKNERKSCADVRCDRDAQCKKVSGIRGWRQHARQSRARNGRNGDLIGIKDFIEDAAIRQIAHAPRVGFNSSILA